MSSSSPVLSKNAIGSKASSFLHLLSWVDLLPLTSSLAPLELFIPLDEEHVWMPLFGKSPKFYFLKNEFLQTQDQGGKLETSNFLKIEELEN